MSVFNPKILDACIRDVTACLPDDEKADILLYAMGHLHHERLVARLLLAEPVSLICAALPNLCSSRILIENAVQSCLSLSKLSLANATKARLIRAKARLAAGLHVGAHQGLRCSRHRLDGLPVTHAARTAFSRLASCHSP